MQLGGRVKESTSSNMGDVEAVLLAASGSDQCRKLLGEYTQMAIGDYLADKRAAFPHEREE